MSRIVSFVRPPGVLGSKMLTTIRRFSLARRLDMGVGTLVTVLSGALASVLVGLVTDLVTRQQGWGLGLAVVTLVLAVIVLAPRPAPPVPDVVPAGEVVTAPTRYGVPAGTEGSLGRLVSTVMSSAYVGSPAGSTETGPVNLLNERLELKKYLEADRSKVILVHGPPGGGKSTLVSSVLQDTGLESRARQHELAPGERLDAKALLDDIEPGPRAGTVLKPDEDLRGRLEAAMEARRGSPATIVVDGAQSLFEPGNNVNGQLAEALEVIASGRPRRVKVILIVQERPVPGSGSAWHGTEDRIFVGGLRHEYFNAFLERLNPAFEFGLADRTTTELGGLYDVLQGNPRQAEMYCAALGLPQSRLNADELARQLAQELPEERGKLLASAVVESLSQDQRRVVAALAAYGIPVTIEHVNELLAGKPSAGQVGVLMPELINWRVIGKASDRYYLSAPEIGEALLQSGDLYADLLWKAVEKVSRYQTPEKRIKSPEDLRWHFAELDIMIREAQLNTSYDDPWAPSYGKINRIQPIMERVLRRWNAEGLLLKYRETIKGNLQDSYREMVNSNALGCIYMSRGRFDDAHEAFNDALQHASDGNSSDARRKILINLAAVSWNSGRTSCTEKYYRQALEDYNARDPAKATENGGVLDLVTAEAGLADCYRRWGRFDDAIDHGMRALSAARDQRSQSSVDIAVKLAQWRSELNQQEVANRLMKEADRAASEHADPALRVHCLAGHASLLLDAGNFRKARRVAKKALRKALKLRDTVTVLRASTTLAMACLMLGDFPAAQHDIDSAARYRREGRSLDVLALQALTAFRSGPDGEKARELFAELEEEADQRQKRDKWDFAAWNFKGLAFCGMHVGEAASAEGAVEAARSLKGAVDAFRDARKLASAPGLDTQLKRWLEILREGANATHEQMEPVMDIIDSPAEAAS